MNDVKVNDALKALDAAPSAVMSDALRNRAAARLQEIVTTPPAQSRRHRTLYWRVAAAGIAAAAVLSVIVATDVGTPAVTFASWTATPGPLGAQERALAGDACVAAGGRPDAEVVLAERRGEWIGIAAATREPTVTTCLVHLPIGSDAVGEVKEATSGGQGALPGRGQFTDGAISEFTDQSLFGLGEPASASFTIGDVGPGVAGLTITTADGRVVEATVHAGRFLAWWPGRAFGTATEGNGGPAPALTYRITLDDGTVLDNAKPVLPS